MKNYWFIILLVPFILSSCFSTSDLIEATPLGKGNNAIDVRTNGQIFIPVETNPSPGSIGIPGTANGTLEYSRGITEKGDLGISYYAASYGFSVHWKQNFINTEKYAFSLRPSVGYVGIWGDQLGLDVLNTFKVTDKFNIIANGSLYSQDLITGRSNSFLTQSATIGFSYGKKHKLKLGITLINLSEIAPDTWDYDFQNLIIGPNLAYQLSW